MTRVKREYRIHPINSKRELAIYLTPEIRLAMGTSQNENWCGIRM